MKCNLNHYNSTTFWRAYLVISIVAWTSASVLHSVRLQWLFGLKVWLYQSLPELHQAYLNSNDSEASWIKSLVTSVAAETPLRGLKVLNFNGCSLNTQVGDGTPSSVHEALHSSKYLIYMSS
ncbi:hypothetical protein TNCT_192071 [Trichonephila clavata]|uniref:Uncharacterized protein n=1 Tax=Trichonephila clavata TaxID=2740835 RepID=A0A8X6LH14_TRICU|nr:hypothetical protein TNCT_192071 [Trichonephila clavata]